MICKFSAFVPSRRPRRSLLHAARSSAQHELAISAAESRRARAWLTAQCGLPRFCTERFSLGHCTHTNWCVERVSCLRVHSLVLIHSREYSMFYSKLYTRSINRGSKSFRLTNLDTTIFKVFFQLPFSERWPCAPVKAALR